MRAGTVFALIIRTQLLTIFVLTLQQVEVATLMCLKLASDPNQTLSLGLGLHIFAQASTKGKYWYSIGYFG